MSFWAGVASGFKDAKAAKAEKEELEARRAERKETFEYNVKRDKEVDAATKAFRDQQQSNWKIKNDREVVVFNQNRDDRLAKEAQDQENFELTFSTSQEWKGKEWAQGVDKWNFTKDQAKEATAHSNKLFNLALDKFEYSQDRDVVQDALNFRAEARTVAEALRVKEAQTFNQELADKNFKLREEQFEEQMRAAGVSEDLASRGFALKERAANLDYTKSIVEMIPAPLAAALAGDDGKLVPIGSKTAALGSKEFVVKYNTELSKQEQESPFFKAALRSPTAQTTLQAFIKAQVGKGNNIKMSELPEYFSYLGQVGGKGEKEALETVKNMLKGDGLDNPTDMAKGLLNLHVYTPTEELFEMTSVPKDATRDEKGFGIWKTATANEARLDMGKLPDGEKKTRVEQAIAGLKLDKSNPVHYQVLAELGYGKNIQSDYNLAENPIVKSFYGEPVEADLTGGGQGGGTVAIVDKDNGLPGSSESKPASFKSAEILEQARSEGFTGFAKVNGEVIKVDPLSNEEEYLLASGVDRTPGKTAEEIAEEEMEAELAEMKRFEMGDNLKEEGAVAEYFGKQTDALGKMGSATTDEQAEGNRPGEREIDTEKFVDRSFQGKGEEVMDLAEANVEIVTAKVEDVVDSIPPRTPKGKRVEWAMKEFKKKYKNANVHMSDEEIEVRIASLVNSVNQ